jgi:hypothetical protein
MVFVKSSQHGCTVEIPERIGRRRQGRWLPYRDLRELLYEDDWCLAEDLLSMYCVLSRASGLLPPLRLPELSDPVYR